MDDTLLEAFLGEEDRHQRNKAVLGIDIDMPSDAGVQADKVFRDVSDADCLTHETSFGSDSGREILHSSLKPVRTWSRLLHTSHARRLDNGPKRSTRR